ncbi:MAG: hypothetical protein J6B87_06455 [Clostridia bacterium]|nr:hypothetical protein [Clostridia bacterium]
MEVKNVIDRIRSEKNYTSEELKLNILIISEKIKKHKEHLFKADKSYYLIVRGANMYMRTLHRVIKEAREKIQEKDNITILDKNLDIEMMYKM